MRISHIAVVSLLALSVMLDGLLPLNLPESVGTRRSGHAVRDLAGKERYRQLDRGVTLGPVHRLPDAQLPLPPIVSNRSRNARDTEHNTNTVNTTTGDNSDNNSMEAVDVTSHNTDMLDYRLATWVHRSLSGEVTASGSKYNPMDIHYIASNDYPLHTILEITHNDNVITGTVVDRGMMEGVDLSEAGFLALAGRLETGVISVAVRRK